MRKSSFGDPMRFALLLLVLFISTSTSAQAATFDFACITGNIAGDCAIGEAQLTVDVTDAGAGQVRFDFYNSGPSASSITDVYFDDGSILGIATIINTPTMVEFSAGASPPNLPGANGASPAFVATAGFSVDSDPPVQPLGVNPGEMLGLVYDLIGGQDFNDVIAELSDGTLRIGIHVQGYGTGGSESFVNNVPEPSTALLLATGLCGLAMRRRAA